MSLEGVLDTVYLLQHSHALGDKEGMLLIGVYGSEAEASAAQVRVQDKPGFIGFPEAFRIMPYVMNKEYWIEGCLDK